VLYQNTLYASLRPTRRASLSIRMAEAMMSAHGNKAPVLAAELAYLFEAGRDFSRAAQYFLIASERSRQVYADREALALAERGIAMIRELPDSPERVARELNHLMGLALPMHGVKGYAAPELVDVFRRVRQLCDTLGENPQLFGAVAAIGAFHFMRAELGPATEAIAEMRRLSEITGDPVMSIWTDWAHGATFSHFGISLQDTMQELDRGARLYDERMHAGFMLMTGFDAGMGCELQGARVAWMLGDAEGAATRIDATLAQARKSRHPLMLAFALFFQAWIRQHERDPEGVLAVTSELLPLVDQYGYPHVGAWARILDGWARAMTGQPAEGEAAIREGLGVLDAIGILLMRPNYLALLAEAQALQGGLDAALATLDLARETAARTEERCYLAEIHRLTGHLVSQAPDAAGRADAVERHLREAVSVARQQGTVGFERRAEATLASFLHSGG
jgi:predicted ATPase